MRPTLTALAIAALALFGCFACDSGDANTGEAPAGDAGQQVQPDGGAGGGADATTSSPGGVRVQVLPTRVTFEGVRSDESASRSVSLVSVGTEPLVVDELKLSASRGFSVLMDGQEYVPDERTRAGVPLDPPVELAWNESLDVEVRFTPERPDGAEGTLQLHTNAPGDEIVTVYLEAIQSGPLCTVAPERLDFDARPLEEPALRQLAIQSRGTRDLTFTSIEFVDGSSDRFSLDWSSLGEDVEPPTPDEPLVIPPSNTATLDVHFTPLEVGVEVAATLRIETDEFYGVFEVPMTGHGTHRPGVCPLALIECDAGHEVAAGTTINLSAEQLATEAGDITRYQWSVDGPEEPAPQFVPSATAATPSLTLSAEGDYRISLEVWDDEDLRGCDPALYGVRVTAP